MRRRVLAFRRWASGLGWTDAAIAACLGITERTMQRWEVARQRDRLRLRGRGRPARRSDRSTRQRLLALLELLGPGVGVPTLHAFCPTMARREVQDMLRRYRRVWRRRHRLLLHVLHWQRPGTVWAIDFAEPPAQVDGCYEYLLAVRDLASGVQLLWLPVADETAATAVLALRSLFRQHGPPLVLKSDNGSAFVAAEMKTLLSGSRVWQLRSPPEWPAYNGSCEAGIGSMRTRTHHQSVRRDRPGEWTSDDVEAARLQANEGARPWGFQGPTPDECWGRRMPIRPTQRAAFGVTVLREQLHAREEQGHAEDDPLTPTAQAAVDRLALSRALVDHELLTFTQETRPAPMQAARRKAGRIQNHRGDG